MYVLWFSCVSSQSRLCLIRSLGLRSSLHWLECFIQLSAITAARGVDRYLDGSILSQEWRLLHETLVIRKIFWMGSQSGLCCYQEILSNPLLPVSPFPHLQSKKGLWSLRTLLALKFHVSRVQPSEGRPGIETRSSEAKQAKKLKSTIKFRKKKTKQKTEVKNCAECINQPN